MSDITGPDSVTSEPALTSESVDASLIATQPAAGPLQVPSPADTEVTVYIAPQQEIAPARRLLLTGAERFWYALQCIAFGTGYFAKVPTKEALSEAGLAKLTGAEHFWYVVQCIAFGSGYFAKVPVKKALSETGLVHLTGAEQFWYVVQCIAFGSGYFAKVPHKKALSELASLPGTPASR